MENLWPKDTGFKKIGIYLIILLALLRFWVYPFHHSLIEKKFVLEELSESFRLKSQIFEKHKYHQNNFNIVGKDTLFPFVYEKEIPYSNIQVEVLGYLQELAEKNGLTFINFEMMEPVVSRGISEVPVLVRLKGPPGTFIEVLKGIEKGERLLVTKTLEITRSDPDLNFSLMVSSFRIEK